MRTTLLVSLLLIFGNCIYAQTSSIKPSHAKAAEDLLIVTETKESLNQGIATMLKMQLDNNPALKSYEQVFKDFFNKYMSYEALKPDMIKMYADEFTEAELRELIAFYNTPSGKKLAKKQGILMSKGAQIGQDKVKGHMAELETMIKAVDKNEL